MKLEIFDPPMCCPTGVCGPNTDPALLAIQDAILALKKLGVEVERYSLTHQINHFMQNEVVAKLLNEKGLDALPLTLVNGEVFATGQYPSYEELAKAFNL
jgi:hypothetical protein